MNCSFCGREEPLAAFKLEKPTTINFAQTENSLFAKIVIEDCPCICHHCVLVAL